MSALPVEITITSTRNESDEFVEAAPPVSIEVAIAEAVEVPEPCCDLERAAKFDAELFRVLAIYPFSKKNFARVDWVAAHGRVVSVAVANHDIHCCCSVLATIPRLQILRHLRAFLERHDYWDEEMGV